jgi:Fur family ferric uptake transcriptional regulator
MTYNTEKRAEILSFLGSCRGEAVTIDSICNSILKDGKGKSTVYRLISKLVDEGAVRKISDARTRHVTYQYINGGSCAEHLHLKCTVCGRLLHLDDETTHLLENKIFNSRGFRVDDSSLLYGRCGDCIYKNKKAEATL